MSKWKDMAERTTILRCRVGSQAYGLSMESSDLDEKGVCVEDFSAAFPLNGDFEQYEFRTAAERTGVRDARSEPGDLDLTIYSLRKFLRLTTYGNPNVVELLFITDDNLLSSTSVGRELQALYPYIVSRQAGRRYLGYMEAQKQRLLGERGQMRVTRTDLIDKYGYDTKYAGHLLRLGLQGVELQETGRVTLPMNEDDKLLLLGVRAGLVPFEDVTNMAGRLETQIKDLIKDGPLQDQPNYEVVEDWMRGVYMKTWNRV